MPFCCQRDPSFRIWQFSFSNSVIMNHFYSKILCKEEKCI
uniref:Uncharacterized protein n=1 Tax=Anguilla anguilla TaxID=7936 RepID=A0A0E9WIV8_ANGAN